MGDAAKRAAAQAACSYVEDGMVLGLGTGSTVEHLLVALAASGRDVVGIPTSEATARRCRELGIALRSPDTNPTVDLAIDGADELDATLTLVKGGGGALFREKIVAAMAERFVVIAGRDKLVARLGDSFAIPVEVLPFAQRPVRDWLTDAGYEVVLRHRDGQLATTDNGNLLLDARWPGGLEDPAASEIGISLLPGVVACGLFVELADVAVLGDDDGATEEIHAPRL